MIDCPLNLKKEEMVKVSRQILRLLLRAGFLMAVANAIYAQSAASYPRG